jgi:hypothetical protein
LGAEVDGWMDSVCPPLVVSAPLFPHLSPTQCFDFDKTLLVMGLKSEPAFLPSYPTEPMIDDSLSLNDNYNPHSFPRIPPNRRPTQEIDQELEDVEVEMAELRIRVTTPPPSFSGSGRAEEDEEADEEDEDSRI